MGLGSINSTVISVTTAKMYIRINTINKYYAQIQTIKGLKNSCSYPLVFVYHTVIAFPQRRTDRHVDITERRCGRGCVLSWASEDGKDEERLIFSSKMLMDTLNITQNALKTCKAQRVCSRGRQYHSLKARMMANRRRVCV